MTEGSGATIVTDYEAMHQTPTPSRLRRTSPINYAALREQGKIICCHHTVILMLLIGSATPMGSMSGGIAHPRLKPWVTST